jgi:hypothetical protein
VFDDDQLLALLGPNFYEGDLALGGDGEVQIANQDLVAWNWVESLNAALLRRLNTPLGAIASSVWGTEGVLVLNAGYGNPAFRAVSEPRTPETTQLLKSGVLACLAQEDRVVVREVSTRYTLAGGVDGLPLLVFDIVYGIAGTDLLQSLSLGADQSAGVFIQVTS